MAPVLIARAVFGATSSVDANGTERVTLPLREEWLDGGVTSYVYPTTVRFSYAMLGGNVSLVRPFSLSAFGSEPPRVSTRLDLAGQWSETITTGGATVGWLGPQIFSFQVTGIGPVSIAVIDGFPAGPNQTYAFTSSVAGPIDYDVLPDDLVTTSSVREVRLSDVLPDDLVATSSVSEVRLSDVLGACAARLGNDFNQGCN
jgi:hypothetical protein